MNVEAKNEAASEALVGLDWSTILPFIAIHLMPLGIFFVEHHWKRDLIIGLIDYILLTFFVTAGFHRYFAHRSYKMGRVMQFIMAFGGTADGQKGPLWWTAHHRYHHKYSDKPQDISSPRDGFFWSHLGWIFVNSHKPIRYDMVPDLMKYPELRLLDRFYLAPAFLVWTTIYFCFGASALFTIFWVHVISYHVTFSINSLTHLYGSRRYNTDDDSRNVPWLGILAFGEGWHNNHHHYQSSANMGFFWWEIDISYYMLKVLSWFGLVWDLRKPPQKILMADSAAI